MPKSQSSDADDTSDASKAKVDDKPTCQENQHPPLSSGLKVTEQFLIEQARITDFFCILLIVALIAASTVTFCITRSMLSYGFLTFLTLLPSIRRRKEEAIFPISNEDFQIKLKELDVEIERVRKQNARINFPIFAWLRRLIYK